LRVGFSRPNLLARDSALGLDPVLEVMPFLPAPLLIEAVCELGDAEAGRAGWGCRRGNHPFHGEPVALPSD
jgi:hypothetical protein